MTLFHDVWDASSPSHSLNSCEAVDGLLTGLHWSRLEMTSSSVWLGVTCRVQGLSVSYVIVLAPVALIVYCKIPIVFLILLLVDEIRLWGAQEHLPSWFPTFSILSNFFFLNLGLDLLHSVPQVGQLGSTFLSHPSSLLRSSSALPGAAAEWAAESQSCIAGLSSTAAGQVNTLNCDLNVSVI